MTRYLILCTYLNTLTVVLVLYFIKTVVFFEGVDDQISVGRGVGIENEFDVE